MTIIKNQGQSFKNVATSSTEFKYWLTIIVLLEPALLSFSSLILFSWIVSMLLFSVFYFLGQVELYLYMFEYLIIASRKIAHTFITS
jgi:hypothetical protein